VTDATTTALREELRVPDRFERLREAGTGALRSIVVPVADALRIIDARFTDMRAAGRGSLMILRGDTGAGKSTFLDTVGLFRNDVVTVRVPSDDDIAQALGCMPSTTGARIVVLEGREALGQVSAEALEAGMHAINAFLRTDAGLNTLVVWPANTDDPTERLVDLATKLGGEALFGIGEPVQRFVGPSRDTFVEIAERTVAAQ
jgi:hypothetical protein